jgi:RNA polymerase sigma-70 factor, ECF subfamily
MAIAPFPMSDPPPFIGLRSGSSGLSRGFKVGGRALVDPLASQWVEAIESIARRADRAAFTALFTHFAPRIKGFLLKRGVADGRADEIAQETMIAVWRKASLYDPKAAAPGTWIFAIARNLSIDARRRDGLKGLKAAMDIEVDYAIDPALLGDESLIVAERDRCVRAALARLPKAQQEAVRLSFFEERSHSEVAERLGIPLGTVKSRLRLARDRLRLALAEIHK